MVKLLIVSDNVNVTHPLKEGFTGESWHSDHTDISRLTGESALSPTDYKFIVFVIHSDFNKRYSSLLDDIKRKLRATGQLTSLYLIFETEYDSAFSSWLLFTKRLFAMGGQSSKLQIALDEIIKLESVGVSRNDYFSPTDAYL